MIDGNATAMPEIITELEGNGLNNTYSYGGLTIRQHFAAMAMQGLLANGDHNAPDLAKIDERQAIAVYSVQLADALIAELNKQK